jgi:hypothetical protein
MTNRTISCALAALVLALPLAAPGCGDEDDSEDAAPAVTVTESTTTDQTGSTTTGSTTSTTSTTTDETTTTGETTTDDDGTEAEHGDVSGNCDEAEHADDPECQ